MLGCQRLLAQSDVQRNRHNAEEAQHEQGNGVYRREQQECQAKVHEQTLSEALALRLKWPACLDTKSWVESELASYNAAV